MFQLAVQNSDIHPTAPYHKSSVHYTECFLGERAEFPRWGFSGYLKMVMNRKLEEESFGGYVLVGDRSS